MNKWGKVMGLEKKAAGGGLTENALTHATELLSKCLLVLPGSYVFNSRIGECQVEGRIGELCSPGISFHGYKSGWSALIIYIQEHDIFTPNS